jgi:hypothetical protein
MAPEDTAIKKLVEQSTNTTSGEDTTGDSAKGWIDYKNRGKKGYRGYRKGRGSSGGSGGGISFSWELMELLQRLTEETDQGRVINPNFGEGGQ